MTHVEKQRKSLHDLHLLSLGVHSGPTPKVIARQRKSEAVSNRRDAETRLENSMKQRQNAQLLAVSQRNKDDTVARARFILMQVQLIKPYKCDTGSEL